ncbi:hypothetical protein FDZ84_24330 [Saccharopolyspora sp. ASAGF58]|nr:hypothetical protein FDZ84_24330 [Saccharopolyspora sp. ASAGF58]
MRAQTERQEAARLPDVVRVLLEQHARIRGLFAEVKNAQGEQKRNRFDELRALLAVHETAEELVLRPIAKKTAGDAEAEARNYEEEEANQVLAEHEKMDVNSTDVASRLCGCAGPGRAWAFSEARPRERWGTRRSSRS